MDLNFGEFFESIDVYMDSMQDSIVTVIIRKLFVPEKYHTIVGSSQDCD